MRRNRVVLWLGEASPHQAGWLEALVDLLPRHTLISVFQRQLQTERLALGWRLPDPGRMETIVSPDAAAIDALASRRPDTSLHIFGGMRLPMLERALRACARTQTLIGIASEARDASGSLGALRLLHSYVVERPYRKRTDFVLAIGAESAQWYERCGYSRRTIFPWAYVVQPPSERPRDRASGQPLPVISFVGQLIRRKGIDTLLRALARLRMFDWLLQIVGEGPERQALEALTESLKLADRVRFLGVRDNAEVWRLLQETDLLVLPSRVDGWGAIVNEALMSGTPVVCSDRCGSADLIRTNDFGETFHAGSVEDLASVMRRWLAGGSLPGQRRRQIREWSRRISGEALARYLVRIIDHVDRGSSRPSPPWRDESATLSRPPDGRVVEASHAYNG